MASFSSAAAAGLAGGDGEVGVLGDQSVRGSVNQPGAGGGGGGKIFHLASLICTSHSRSAGVAYYLLNLVFCVSNLMLRYMIFICTLQS